MTNLEQQAREAAADRFNVMKFQPVRPQTQRLIDLFVNGYLAAAAPREKEISELRARVAELEELASEATLFLDGNYEDQLDLEHRIVVALRGYPEPIPVPDPVA